MQSTHTDRFLNLLDYFIFRISASGEVEAENQSARQLFNSISTQNSRLKSLFGLESCDQAFELAGSAQKKEVDILLADGHKKKIRWEFIKINNEIFCTAADWDPVQELVNKARHENLIFKELLLNILPGYIADELVAKKTVHPKVYRHSTIMFTDVVGFSRLSFHLDPVSLIRKLNSYFSLYDRVMEEFGIEKIKTIGDSYMSVSGIPIKKPSHSVDCCLAALNILHLMEEIAKPDRIVENIDLNNWSIRIGIHAGPCISGVVGYKKYTFDIWGDTVNIASRMEKAGAPGKINISESTFKEVEDFFECNFRGSQEVKTIGRVNMYFLNRIKPELSADDRGFFPNTKFNRYYCEKFGIKQENVGRAMLPHFINNYLKMKNKYI